MDGWKGDTHVKESVVETEEEDLTREDDHYSFPDNEEGGFPTTEDEEGDGSSGHSAVTLSSKGLAAKKRRAWTGKEDKMPQTLPSSGQDNKNLDQIKDQVYAGLYYHDNNLASGSLEALIHHLVPTLDYYPDRTFIFTFLLSSRLFIPPHQLLAQVCHLWAEQHGAGHAPAEQILQLLTDWTETFPQDFRDQRMMCALKEVTLHLYSRDQVYREAVSQLSLGLTRRLAVLDQYQEALVKINPRLSLVQAKPRRDLLSICKHPCTVAQQLTHVELERLSYIGPEEFVQAFVCQDQDMDQDQGQKKTSNLGAYVDWFNRLSYLVATEICLPLKKKHRVRVLDFFIHVAHECFNIGNFNSLLAILSGMNMSPVSRLKKTWSKVKTAKFEILERQMDASGNFYNYRTSLRGATQRSRSASSSREKMVVVPFFSLLVKDIYFLQQACASRLHNSHLNFQKLWEMAKHVSEFISWKNVECPFDKDRRILTHLLTSPVCSEDALYLASYESEGPDNNMEKDRWKSISFMPSKFMYLCHSAIFVWYVHSSFMPIEQMFLFPV
ncbi:ras-GEF domain-containing family member 1B-A isoform X4 [Nerophis ophidion]|uniref:ras-GEF domain-containing family member 1B-A isoform X4 n=1 Tax=Nerophis ophidion TaxID=159077 RepID=UPI002AE08DA9|nr:ras-GEF domain-containing family member 1B-A isoform X4 [Nerophis ophidion]